MLFVSNTNRAVDVGLLDTVEALKQTGQAGLLKNVTRFGESAIEDPELEPLLFEAIIAKKMEKKKEKASALAALLSNFDTRQKQADELMAQGKAVPEALDLECMMFGAKIDKEGGRDKIEASIEKLTQANERLELLAKNLVATTLAKVCTSDLFNGMMFDAVVVDEASMAGLPYLLVMAAKSTQHLVLVGDPMQLPPISITSEKTAAEFLEADIFTYISGATSTAELFKWHDQHPEFTSFFDVQYRLGSDLASVISSVFYEGRLKTTDEKQSADSVAFIDTSRYRAYIISKESKYGFHPVNDVHLRILAESIRKLLQRNNAADIGVIVPFRNCVYGHRAYLRSQGISDVEIGTIHTFQGREKPVIIFDTVMSADKTNNFPRHFSVRPFDETKNGLSVPRLLNVACSRSRDKLVVLADMNHVEAVYSDKFFGNLMRALQRHSISVSD